MSIEITTAMVTQFSANVMHLAQQKGSRLRNCVRVEPVKAEKASFEQVGASTAIKRTTRHPDTVYNNTPHRRRWVIPVIYDAPADLVDTIDDEMLLISPESPYAQSQAMSLGRAMDDEIIAAATAAAYTGKEGTSTTSFPTGTHQIAHGSASLTLAKLLAAKKILDAYENDDSVPRYIALNAYAVAALLDLTEVGSSDYNSVKALVKGEVDTFLGFKFVRTERLAVASSVRSVLAWCETSLLLGITKEPATIINTNPAKNNATQIASSAAMGATRMDETGVVEIQCFEA